MQELKVENVIIGKQYIDSENYQKFIQIVKDKKIKVHVVEAGQKVNIEKDICFHILWPSSDDIIHENNINNNSLVCKFQYKEFSILFTGDIEEVSEEKILKKYIQHTKLLQATVLKVPHHGSKSSSTMNFLQAVSPKIALIGVGENNTFGHPNQGVLERLKMLATKTYRTDENGEISIQVLSNGVIKIQKQVQQ